jgi:hypothetical protein
MHNILLLGGFQCQNNDGEALALACSSPVLDCVQPKLAGGDTYKKTANVMTSPGLMGRIMMLHFYAGTYQDYADLLPGGRYR